MSFGSGSPSLKVEGQGTEAERGVVLLVAVFRRGIAGWRREKLLKMIEWKQEN